MTVYVVFEVTLSDNPSEEALAAYASYRAAVPELVAKHGGRYLARAWQGVALEGAPAGDRFHLVEFPDSASVTAFWSSPDYLAIKHGRAEAADVRAVLVEPPQ
jgi:uncharacterized protein (DUF1330 family)